MQDKLKALLHASSQMAKERDLNKTLVLLTNIAKDLLDADRCSIFLFDKDHDELWTIVAHGVKEIRVPADSGIAGYVFQSAKPLNILDAYKDSRFNKDVDKTTGYHTKNILAIPFLNRMGEHFGVFQAINKKTAGYFNDEDLELLKHLAFYATSNIETAMLYEKLKKAQEDVVFRLSHATGFKDPETRNHIIRVGLYCEFMGKILGWNEDELENIRLAAPMHDIGKVGIPDNILKKPARLTKDEFSIMKKHTTYGYEILKGGDSHLTQIAAIIALEHHEKWDGTGYPKGKKGEDISIYARMTAISDVFDALTSNRHYKDAWSFDKTFDLLDEEKGKHFDPNLVDIFKKYRKEIIAIKQAYSDHEPAEDQKK